MTLVPSRGAVADVLSVALTEMAESSCDHSEQNTQRHRAYHGNTHCCYIHKKENIQQEGARAGFAHSVNIRNRKIISCSSHSESSNLLRVVGHSHQNKMTPLGLTQLN